MNKSIPEITVIMAAWNSEKFIEDSIKSVLSQSKRDFEFIIVDDYSQDSTAEIVMKFALRDDRIKFLRNEENKGAAASRNRAILLARGKYIAIVDSDDICYEDRLKIQYEFLESSADIFLCSSSFAYINDRNQILSVSKANLSYEKVKLELPKKNIIHNPTVMFRSNRGYLFREKFAQAEDYDLWLRSLSNNEKMVVLDNVLMKYRVHSTSLTNTSIAQQKYFLNKALAYYRQRIITGADSYEEDILDFRRKERISGEALVQSRKIKFLFKENASPCNIRKEISLYLIKYSCRLWPQVYFYLLISFLPYFIRKAIVRLIFY